MSVAAQPSTRERILDIALELFTENGYDKTSLRDIAERLGTTKAALYYHFARKEDILLELHLRLHALSHDALAELASLDSWQARAEAWPRLLDEFVAKVADQRELILLHTRNPSALARLEHNERHQAENETIEAEVGALLSNPEAPLAQRVRMACSIGAVLTGLVDAGNFFTDVSSETLTDEVRAVVADMFR
jgi:AcrR family transcriptional regulator